MFLNRNKQHNLLEFYNFSDLPLDKPRNATFGGARLLNGLTLFWGTHPEPSWCIFARSGRRAEAMLSPKSKFSH
jgi:hypothetical protein